MIWQRNFECPDCGRLWTTEEEKYPALMPNSFTVAACEDCHARRMVEMEDRCSAVADGTPADAHVAADQDRARVSLGEISGQPGDPPFAARLATGFRMIAMGGDA